jgi:UDP-N-acetylmuramate dehydrogenase
MIETKKFLSAKFHREILIDELMSRHTSFKIGGPVDILFIPNTITQIVYVINFCQKNNIEFFVMGNGTNLLVSDDGFRGIIIKINRNLSHFDLSNISNGEICVQAGVLLTKLASIALNNNLSGLEFASGIPGTVGGAVCMNAGAYNHEIKDILVSAEILHNNQIKILLNDDMEFSYRSSIINREFVVLSARFKLKIDEHKKVYNLMKEVSAKRISSQPIGEPSAGSVFKKVKDHYTGKLIMDAGLKGYKIGNAKVSEKHCGFIINTGGATASDVIRLINIIQKKVADKFNLYLEPEIKYLGIDKMSGIH